MTKFSRTQKFTKANIANVPQNKAIIYKIKSRQGENLYTGIAGRGRSQDRLLEHKDLKKEQIPEGTRFQYAQVNTKDRAHQIEKSIINKEQPEQNDLDRRLKEHLDLKNEENECLVERLRKYHAAFSFVSGYRYFDGKM